MMLRCGESRSCLALDMLLTEVILTMALDSRLLCIIMMLLSKVVDHYNSDYLSIAMAAIVSTEATIDKCDMKFVRRQKLVPNCQSL